MIEAAMYIALGFLAASFLALVTIPAVSARADRLARRRLEAQLPRSLAELNAERDRLRAELAMRERRIEQKLEKALAGRQADLALLGTRALRIDSLGRDVAERDARIAALEADLARTRTDLDGTRTDLVDVRGDLADAREVLARFKAAQADLQARHDAALSEIDAKRITISDLETRLSTQTKRAHDLDRLLTQRVSELEVERAALATTRAALADEEARGRVLDQRHREALATIEKTKAALATTQERLRGLEGERDGLSGRLAETESALARARAETVATTERLEARAAREAAQAAAQESALRAMTERVEVLKAEKTSLEGALAVAREERARSDRAAPRKAQVPAPVRSARRRRPETPATPETATGSSNEG